MKRNFNFHGKPEDNKKVRKALDKNDSTELLWVWYNDKNEYLKVHDPMVGELEWSFTSDLRDAWANDYDSLMMYEDEVLEFDNTLNVVTIGSIDADALDEYGEGKGFLTAGELKDIMIRRTQALDENRDENGGGVLREAHRALNRAIESLEAIKREMAMNKEGYQRVGETITSIQDLIPHIIHNIGKNKAGDNWDEDDYEDTEVDHYEVLWYEGDNIDEAMSGDFLTKEFETEEEAMAEYHELKKRNDVFGLWVTSRDADGELIDDIEIDDR